MALLGHQQLFLLDVAKLIVKAKELGYVATAGELWRPQAMQDIYLREGKTHAKFSNHTERLAIDLNLFKDNVLCTAEEVRPLGHFWESLSNMNRWGGNFTTIKDGPHFERNIRS